jgi:dTDP-4-amino-4,6-dideoxygalactose transaminase
VTTAPSLVDTPLRRDDSPKLDGRVPVLHRARTALWHGLHALGLEPGARILFPAYCCGAELEVALCFGLRPVFYGLDSRYQPDQDQIAALLRGDVRAMFVIHYFGRTASLDAVRDLARDRGAVVIDDCAHALYAQDDRGRDLSARASLALFCATKHLPAPNGGFALLRDGREIAPTAPLRRAPAAVAAKSIAFRLAGELNGRAPLAHDALRRWLGRRMGEGGIGTALAFDPGAASWRGSLLTRFLLAWTDGAQVRERRRRNFVRLARKLTGSASAPVWSDLPAGSSPYLFPVMTARPDDLRLHLQRLGIESVAFWRNPHPAVPGDGFRRERMLRERVVALPVHHGLDAEDMARIASALRSWSPGR